ncbi:cytochrome D1 domain-containing protein [Magnetospirillum aberrantis]|uniref:Protein nirF n=1 Tax=Magnetospirillum aberrantis SpK TaxID=908842 RepID=A0A7C9UXE7_9PROT|nr:cytochrome D1 domain-containing protein [Magnetospirillum aberrantis]NFV81010.1 protein nirF [Magnetospirillum aberrantis SpK]
MKTLLLAVLAALSLSACVSVTATGDLGVVIERADGKVAVVNTTERTVLAEIDGLGDLSHASVVFSRDQRFAFVFGRDGGLTKVDLVTQRIAGRVLQSGNSIGGAISQDGRLVAVSNYEPGGVRVFDADSLEMVADIPTGSKVVGLVDAPGRRFVFSLFDAGEIWMADFSQGPSPRMTRYANVGKQPYDALITDDGRTYIAGLFGEDGFALLDLWHPERGVRRVLDGYGRGEQPLPVYKMPHLEWLTVSGGLAYLPAIGRHEVLVMDTATWRQVGAVPVLGQPVFIVAQPDKRRLWVNFAFPDNDKVQLIDVESRSVAATLTTGKGTLHLEFTPRGEEVWLSLRDEDAVSVWDVATLTPITRLNIAKPSGIFFTPRAYKTGM